jgi:spermidine/putrescine transport system ATP-binding protein
MSQSVFSPLKQAAPAPRQVERDASDGLVDVQFRDVVKKFGQVVAVDRINLAIPKGSFYSFLGPSGCGKTTSLRLIGGFEQPDQGDIFIGGEPVAGVPPYHRHVNMVFQHYALFPHMDVAKNVGYGLRQRRPRLSKAEIDRRVGEALALVRLSGYEQRRAWELSGGQQQRVALARALINQPTVLLLDEPLGALDRQLRKEMQVELKNLQREVGITFVFVTHDQEEALSMSDCIAVMRDGQIVQAGPPYELYNQPVDRYVAGFIGQSNFWAGEVVETGEWATLRTGSGLLLRAPRPRPAEPLPLGSRAVIALRPERITLFATNEATPRNLAEEFMQVKGRILQVTFLGDQTEYHVLTDSLGQVLVRTSSAVNGIQRNLALGDAVTVQWANAAGLALLDD